MKSDVVYSQLTDDDIKNRIRSKLAFFDDKILVEQIIEIFMDENIKTFFGFNPECVSIFRNFFGINDTRTPKTTQQLKEMYNYKESTIKDKVNSVFRDLRVRFFEFYERFHLDEVKLSNEAKRYLFFSTYRFPRYIGIDSGKIEDYIKNIPNDSQNPIEYEIKNAFSNWYSKYLQNYNEKLNEVFIEEVLDKPIEYFFDSNNVRGNRYLKEYNKNGVRTIRDFFEKFKWGHPYNFESVKTGGFDDICSIIFFYKKENTLNSFPLKLKSSNFLYFLEYLIREVKIKMKNDNINLKEEWVQQHIEYPTREQFGTIAVLFNSNKLDEVDKIIKKYACNIENLYSDESNNFTQDEEKIERPSFELRAILRLMDNYIDELDKNKKQLIHFQIQNALEHYLKPQEVKKHKTL